MSVIARHLDATDATWPAAERQLIGPWAIRRGLGGGKRVSAALPLGPATVGEITEGEVTLAESAMAAIDQQPLFRLTAADARLDALLAARGYALIDPTNIYSAPAARVAAQPVPGEYSAVLGWSPLAIQREIWAAGGIGPDRLAVMARAAGPRISAVLQLDNSVGGTVFAAIHHGIAMLHALEITPPARRQGMGRYGTVRIARWAVAQGAADFALLCTRANDAANRLYSSLGMEIVGHYHYRQKPAPETDA
ncbi:GNAT family N-acetyltransferase [Pseudooceanicola aestuarii]|uniref:GNAT family N-acetyltransferase n=1 Tax=Pseudooceanicola aestuarii TaxID=2697319 RepID=UPI001EF8AD46|nr:GNAT family N-acetyltransferase [Pseudooceanicola aestuarii]